MKLLMAYCLLMCFSAAIAQDLPSISPVQALIDRASPGDTVYVVRGVYEGDLEVSKTLALVGVGRPVLRGSGEGSCLTIMAPGCLVRGFVIERSGSDVMREDAGILVRSDFNRIEQNEMRDILFGIYLLESDANFVIGNTILGRGHLDYGQRGSGIHIWNSNDNVFEGNVVSDARDGFYIQYARRTRISGNAVYNTRYGLHYMYADSNSFSSNRFTSNVAGAAIMYSRDITFRHNVFAHNRGFASYGILFQDCRGIVADSNVIADNVVGMFFEASSGNLFRHNVIAQNDLALQIFQNSNGNVLTENNFLDNLNPLAIVGKRTESEWSLDGRGNYWSNYGGYDLDADGIGDVPMKIQNVFDYLEGRTPNLRVYLYSPASQALAAASSAFPIIDVNKETDEYPLMRPVNLGAIPSVVMAQGSSKVTGAREIFLGIIAGAGVAGTLLFRKNRKNKNSYRTLSISPTHAAIGNRSYGK